MTINSGSTVYVEISRPHSSYLLEGKIIKDSGKNFVVDVDGDQYLFDKNTLEEVYGIGAGKRMKILSPDDSRYMAEVGAFQWKKENEA